jgi:nitrite reductase/ring-hydroxylating ferredoxin subunit
MLKLCTLNEIPTAGAKGFSLGGKNLVALNFRGAFYIYENSCPHRSIPLEWQPDQFLDYEKTFIQCATHGALFKIDTGECISGPCVEDRLKKVPFTISNDSIFVNL